MLKQIGEEPLCGRSNGAERRSVWPLGLSLGVGSQVSAMLNADTPIMQWPDLLDQPRPKADRTIAYGKDPLQLVDLWLPAGKGRIRSW